MNSADSSSGASPTMVNAFDQADLSQLPDRVRAQVVRRNTVLGSSYRLFYRTPVEVVRGHGVLLYDAEGNDYLDAYNNVPCVGHSHPKVAAAVSAQMTTLNTNTRYIQESILDYSEQLLATFPDELGKVIYTCTGSEANDLAMRVARYVTGREGVIVTANAYHGLTAQVAAFSPSLGPNSPLGPHVRVIDAPDELRLPDGETVGRHMRAQVRSAIADLERHGAGLCAFIADSIFSSDGIFAHPRGFLRDIADEVHRAGGLYIADEVQPGFGRNGDGWWGFQRHDVLPDIVTVGKPMGNGIPTAAAIFRPDLLDQFGSNIRYFNTFGGNSVSIAAAQAVLDVIREDELISNAHRVGAYLMDGLRAVTAADDRVLQVRGAGLFIGVDMVTDRESATPDGALADDIVNGLRERRVLISASGPSGNVLKVRPPLPFGMKDADRLLEEFERALSTRRAPR
ncbi:MAG TPA: aspartate aminotransferase family protein [Pseudonocardia sp.]|uniref:aspartate aminotransferase family protein n=1 Tax=Pseudonocardia sp. TaxID=60912 RepID=UPI002C9DDD97|nr:aspartate aminotransferase family protein [Pseudonocardia sp.]HTF52038.1 aspartate aminotransferase family protein [Pseudonocardia sp.]